MILLSDNDNEFAKVRIYVSFGFARFEKSLGLELLWVEKVWAQNMFSDFLAELDHTKTKIATFLFSLPPPFP